MQHFVQASQPTRVVVRSHPHGDRLRLATSFVLSQPTHWSCASCIYGYLSVRSTAIAESTERLLPNAWRGLLVAGARYGGVYCVAPGVARTASSGTADRRPQTVPRSGSVLSLYPPTVSEVAFLSDKNDCHISSCYLEPSSRVWFVARRHCATGPWV